MRILVLGSGAGGGVPQWNCRCPVCEVAWTEPERVRHRTQTSIAVSARSDEWIVVDAAPELRHQIIASPPLQPREAGRHSPIAAVFLTSGDIDHIAGLLCLREGHRFSIFATAPTLGNLASSPLFDVLRPGLVTRRALTPGEPVEVAGLTVTGFAVPGKVPLYREDGLVSVGAENEDVIGLEITDGRHRLAYVPGTASLPAPLVARLGQADLLLLDGTTFTDDELSAAGVSAKSAGRMGHLPMSGEGGSLHAFPPDVRASRTYIHLNNTNPVLIEDSPERAVVTQAGWTVAHDGLEIVL